MNVSPLFILLELRGVSLPLENPVLIFSLILFIILFAPILLNKLRIPHLIGLIIAGAIIGPNGFNVIDRDSSIILFGTVGLLYIMFLAGLEIDLAEFRKNSLKSLLFGMYTFVIPMTMGITGAIYIFGFSWQTSMLLGSMFAAHTLITFPIISKLGVSKNRAVTITVGGTLIADTLALLVLSVIVGLQTGTMDENFWWRLSISVLMMGGVILLVFPIIARWFFKNFKDNISQYIFVLAMVFLGAFMAEAAGVEAIIGAFLAGLSLNRLIPATSPLMNRIEFAGNALFIPFFLIGVGMLIDYRVFFTDIETLQMAAFMTLLATGSKYIAAWLAQKSFRFSADERRLIFGLSNARVAATLAIVLVGYNIIVGQDADGNSIRLLNESVLNGTIIMILVTCTVASFVAQKGARNIALQEGHGDERDESESSERILIAVNDLETADELVNLSITIKSRQNKTGLYALNIIDNNNPKPDEERQAKQLLQIASKTAASTDNYVQTLIRYDADVVNGISSVAKENKITDIVVGLHKQKGFSDSFLGNLAEGILAKSNTTVLIYKPAQPLNTIKRNLVIVPEKAEREIGFPFWLIKVWNITRNTGAKLLIYAGPTTVMFIKSIIKKHPISAEFAHFTEWEDFLILAREVRKDDNLFIIMSRKNHPSYKSAMAKIPSQLTRYFTENNFILIYPVQDGISEDEHSDLKNPSVLEPLQENLGRLDDIAKTITKLFKKR